MSAPINPAKKEWRKLTVSKVGNIHRLSVNVRTLEMIEHGFKRSDFFRIIFKTYWNNGKMIVEFKKKSILGRILGRRK